jgi:hypothetical protein
MIIGFSSFAPLGLYLLASAAASLVLRKMSSWITIDTATSRRQ